VVTINFLEKRQPEGFFIVFGHQFSGLHHHENKLSRYRKIPLANAVSGREIVGKMLRENGIYDVKVTSAEGISLRPM